MDLAGHGIAIGNDAKQVLRTAGLGPKIDGRAEEDTSDLTDGRGHLWLTPEQAKEARERKNDPQKGATSYLDKIPKKWIEEWSSKTVTKDDWVPDNVAVHNEEYRAFIGSHIPRFDHIKSYKPFYLYIKQAQDWLAEKVDIQDYEGQEQWEVANREYDRIAENKLYAMDRYGWIKDDQMFGGWRKYYASTPQALIAFCHDCGYSNEIGKGRQAAITSTVMLLMVFDMLTRPSFKGVLVTDDIEFTGKSIFEDKLKMSYSRLIDQHPWLRPTRVPGWAAKKLTFDWSEGTTKDMQRGRTADFTLAASDDTQTINGTSPSVLVFDETQNIPTYTEIKLEARPTMLSNIDGALRVARQVLAYGTGSSHQRGKGKFENEYKGTIKKWNEGADTSSFVPLFLDWTCRPGMTAKRYKEEYDFYLNNQEDDSIKGLSREERMSMFHAAMPSSPDDMFLTSHKTIVPALVIKTQQERILKAQKEWENGEEAFIQRGWFVPIYNEAIPMPDGSPVPYLIIGATWKRAADDDYEAPVKMFMPPEKYWTSRYYQGTDPIQSSSGFSKFASVIWDRVGYMKEEMIGGALQRTMNPTIACILNDRRVNVKECFIQSKLMGMFYANLDQKACKECHEVNQGQEYEAFICSPWLNLKESLWHKAVLPSKYTKGQGMYGVDLKEGRKNALHYDLVRLLGEDGRNIWYYDIWSQVRNIDVVEDAKGNVVWER